MVHRTMCSCLPVCARVVSVIVSACIFSVHSCTHIIFMYLSRYVCARLVRVWPGLLLDGMSCYFCCEQAINHSTVGFEYGDANQGLSAEQAGLLGMELNADVQTALAPVR